MEALARPLEFLRDGAWLTRARIARWAGVTLACSIGFEAFLIFTAHGLNDFDGRPLGTDFSSFYTAGRVALHGLNPYGQHALYQMQQAVFGARTPYYSFAYPPFFVLIAELLARPQYLVSFALWQGSGFVFYLFGMSALRNRYGAAIPAGLYFTCAAGFTAVIINLTHGQTAFLTAALFAFGLALLPEQPCLAGAAFGLLSIKPQLGLLIPFALAAGGYWRSFGSAAVTVLAMAALSTILLGTGIWAAFLIAADQSRHIILDLGGVDYSKMVSVFAWARIWRLPLTAAYSVQAMVSAAVIIGVSLAWRSDADPRTKGAALCLGTLLVTPFALDYDLMAMAPAIALLAMYESGDRDTRYLAAALSCLWIAPLFARFFAATFLLPLGAWCVAAGLVLVLREISQQTRSCWST